MRITLLEDDPAQAAMLVGWLQEVSHEVSHYATSQGLLDDLGDGRFDLMILDWELPDKPGLEVLEQIRTEVKWHVPVLFVTQRDSEADIVTALNAGADDYMVKQISREEFLARVTALGRRLANEELDFEVGPYRFFPESRKVEFGDDEVTLTAKEFDLAIYLFRNLGRLLGREQILRDIWKVSGLNTRTVDMHVSRVKKRLQIAPESGFRIKTIYQHGYRLERV